MVENHFLAHLRSSSRLKNGSYGKCFLLWPFLVMIDEFHTKHNKKVYTKFHNIFRSITLLCGTTNIPQNIHWCIPHSYYYGSYWTLLWILIMLCYWLHHQRNQIYLHLGSMPNLKGRGTPWDSWESKVLFSCSIYSRPPQLPLYHKSHTKGSIQVLFNYFSKSFTQIGLACASLRIEEQIP